MLSIDLNCDMGESTTLHAYSLDKDFELLKYVSSINIACGYHAGDAYTMHQLVEEALLHRIMVGAHPSYPDRDNFGRSNMSFSPERIYDMVLHQIGSLDAFLKVRGARLHHIKAHGALYNMAAKDRVLSDAICKAIKDFDETLILYGLSGSEMIHAANAIGLQTRSEVFADRTYQEDGTLTPRTQPNAMRHDIADCTRQVLQMAQQGTVIAVTGKTITIIAETVCIHGDGEHAVDFAKSIHQSLKEKAIEIKSL